MDQRTEDILLAAVDEYINTGDPVSSERLFLDYDFGIKPAAIRAELGTLNESGWLYQLHTSSGRIPTDKALEFYARKLQKELSIGARPARNIFDLAEMMIGGELKDFVSELSRELHLFGACVKNHDQLVHRSGLDELFSCLETASQKVFYEVAKDIEHLDQRMTELLEDDKIVSHGPRAFIGKRSPLLRNEQVATVLDIVDVDGNRLLFAAFGPRSMNYRKNFRTFLAIRTVLENYAR